ncbi:MAG: sulfatase-like hydrolase/transferase [Bacteroidales bacterium]|nr:sulfatase-like hydrolase/transferase [Bacteroidales bacterium]
MQKGGFLPKQIAYLFCTYIIAICFFFVFRLAILPLNIESVREILSEEGGLMLLFKAFFMGFRFDTLISCFVLSPFLISLILAYYLNIKNRIFYKINHYALVVLFSLCFAICCMDIPYFKYFFTRFNVQAFTWIDNPLFVFKMISQEPTYIIYFFIFITIIILYSWLMFKNYKRFLSNIKSNQDLENRTKKTYILNSLLFILLIGLCFLGMRGRIEKKSPMKVGTAYFSNNPLINQMGLNPNFTLIKSIEEKSKQDNKPLDLMDKNKAKAFVEEEFRRMKSSGNKRENVLGKKTNVVLVIMEAMGTCNIGHFGNTQNLTPNLDYLLNNSVSYENVYTAGIHTYNGVYSTLFGQPALMHKHSMNLTIIPKIEGGLPNVLKENGYSTLYFTTHDDQFDNIGGFLSANGVERIVSVKDYPKDEVKSTLGVSDHVMFNRAIEEINSLDKTKPFFATLLTSANHGPYIFPENITLKPKSKDIKDKMIEYSDWAIGRFIENAKKFPWFENTIFVFIADHGAYKGKADFELPLSYHHTPFFIYSPSKLKPKKVENIGLQIDVTAMISSYLGIENNKTLGIDFETYPRLYGYFSADDKLGVIDNEYYYIWNKNGTEYLYKYKTSDRTNYIIQKKDKAKQMQKYAFSMLMN